MARNFRELTMTPAVLARQKEQYGTTYGVESTGEPDVLGPAERDFIESRDTFYMATVTETGWPYVQHRGGTAGFLRVIDRLLRRERVGPIEAGTPNGSDVLAEKDEHAGTVRLDDEEAEEVDEGDHECRDGKEREFRRPVRGDGHHGDADADEHEFDGDHRRSGGRPSTDFMSGLGLAHLELLRL